MTDVFDELADRLVGLAERSARTAAPAFERFRITKLDPLSFEELDGGDAFDEDDEDVEVHRSVIDLRDADELAVGDVVEVRETDDGWSVTGVIE